MPAAFFSYSRDDSEFALRLAGDLKAAGAHVWLDQLDIEPGQRWARAVQDALNNSPRMLVILSPSSVESTHVDDEVNFALEEHKTVIPVLYRDCKVPFQLRPFQYVDFRADYSAGLKILLKTQGTEALPEPKHDAPQRLQEATAEFTSRKPRHAANAVCARFCGLCGSQPRPGGGGACNQLRTAKRPVCCTAGGRKVNLVP